MGLAGRGRPGRGRVRPRAAARIDRHFGRYVDDGRLAGWLIVVTRAGRIAHSSTYGLRDLEAGAPVEPDTLFRDLLDDQADHLGRGDDAVGGGRLRAEGPGQPRSSRRSPTCGSTARVRRSSPVTVPATEPMRIWHLLTHTSGLTYGFPTPTRSTPSTAAAGFEWAARRRARPGRVLRPWAGLPLLFQPGTEWNYSVATDVLGRLVEVVSGQTLDAFFAERIFGPLGMTDTGCWVDGDEADRLAALYVTATAAVGAVRYDELGEPRTAPAGLLSGGGGLVSTAADYHRFTQMLLRGGELDGVRLLGPPHRAVHDPQPPARRRRPGRVRPAASPRPPSTAWASASASRSSSTRLPARCCAASASTTGAGRPAPRSGSTRSRRSPRIFLTQLMPSSTYPLRPSCANSSTRPWSTRAWDVQERSPGSGRGVSWQLMPGSRSAPSWRVGPAGRRTSRRRSGGCCR